jgi:hypothetical protein
VNVIVDTNVPIVANKAAPQASVQCVATCAQKLKQIRDEHTLVLDDGWHILREYMNNLRSGGQPGAGDAFLRWVLTNRGNPRRCSFVHVTPQSASFAEFPADPELTGFDLSDHKFVAVAIAHPEHPPILNATDSDWWDYRHALNRHGVHIDFVCPDIEFQNP